MRPTAKSLWWMTGGLIVAVLPLVWMPAILALAGMWAVLAVLITLDVLALRRAAITATVTVPESAAVGEPVPVAVEVLSQFDGELAADIKLEVSPPLEWRDDASVAVSLGTLECEVPVDAQGRGEGQVRAVWLRVRGPYGLIEWVRRIPVKGGRVAVLPNTAKLSRLLQLRMARPLHRIGHRLDLAHGEGTEFDSLQSYVAGMDPRQIDWKSSARHHSLMARRYRQERDQRVLLCIDTGRLMQAPIDRLQRLDHAIHMALLLSSVALRARDLVGLHAYGATPQAWVQPASGSHQHARMTRTCAALQPENVETNHALGLRTVLSRLLRRSLIVVFTDFTDSTMAELMIEHLEQLTTKHVVVFVALDDPVVDRPWEELPNSAEGMAAAIMTSELRQARRVVLRRLEVAGVRVVHGAPGQAALSVLQQYTDIKRRGLLG
ncbi:MAG: DUF58 domain-containing protein [Myxococcota bacterium]